MAESIQFITKIEIKNLWNRYDLVWNLDRDVNILSGINGSGKSTILSIIAKFVAIRYLPPELSDLIDALAITFDNNEKFTATNKFIQGVNIINRSIIVNRISTFDEPTKEGIWLDENVKTELDKEFYRLEKRYLDYQLNIGKKAFEIVSHSNGTNAMQEVLNVKKQQERFLQIIDTLFKDTDKKIDRTKNEIAFICGGKTLTPYQLSSGEKQILVILLTVLIQNNKASILFMDEPEISLHFDWQKKLIQYIKELNPNVQIILATHSPAVVMEGWLDKVSEISDLITLDRKAK